MDYKVEATHQLAQEIKSAGFRVFIAKQGNGTWGLYTDEAGSRVVCFQFDLGGFKFSGNYKTDQPRFTGTGWQLAEGSFKQMFNENPSWSLKGSGVKEWHLSTLAEHLATYQASSQYVEV